LENKILDLEKEKQRLIERIQNDRTVTTDSVWEQKCNYLEKQIKLQEKQIETLQNEVHFFMRNRLLHFLVYWR
jgi:PIN domain nuclease of toxin-antitoxin system